MSSTIIARLRERHHDRIIVGKETILYVADVACPYVLGTMLEVAYRIRDDRYETEGIQPAPPEHRAP
jgi:hypothetical protein